MELLRRAAHAVTDLLHAENHDPWSNGESALVSALPQEAPVILDVGANLGDWTAMALSCQPGATVHAFEIWDDTRQRLRERFRDDPRVVVPDVGLHDAAGELAIKAYDGHSQWTSAYDYPHAAPFHWTTARVERGDAYLRAQRLDRVDLLKIDTEGDDLAVLRSFGDALRAGAVGAVQFEYGYAAVYSGALLARFHELLTPLDYTIGWLRHDGLDVRSYRVTDERFFGPNYVAVHAGQPLLLARLSVRHS